MPTLPPFPGRRRADARRPAARQLPNAIAAPRPRSRIVLLVPSYLDDQFGKYVAWVATTYNLPEEEARVLAIERAIQRILATDPEWKAHSRPRRADSPGKESAVPLPTAKVAAAEPAAAEDPFDSPTWVGGPAGRSG